jgi:hypothetical protein
MYPSAAALGTSCGQLINTKHAISNLINYLPTCRTAHLTKASSSGRSLTNPDHQLDAVMLHTCSSTAQLNWVRNKLKLYMGTSLVF